MHIHVEHFKNRIKIIYILSLISISKYTTSLQLLACESFIFHALNSGGLQSNIKTFLIYSFFKMRINIKKTEKEMVKDGNIQKDEKNGKHHNRGVQDSVKLNTHEMQHMLIKQHLGIITTL